MSELKLIPLTPESLLAVMQQAGYRTELLTDSRDRPYLRSSTGGMPFEIYFPNGPAHIDVSFVMSLRIVGALELAIVNRWNNAKRFARLRLMEDVLMLDMDIIAVDGISEASLRAAVAAWDALVLDLPAFLRAEMAGWLSEAEVPATADH